MRSFRVFILLLVVVLAGCAGTVRTPSHHPHQAQHAQHAQQLLDQGHYAKAAQAYAELAKQQPRKADAWRLRAASAWQQAGELAHVRKAFEQVRRSRLSSSDARYYDLIQADLALARGDAARALQGTRNLSSEWPARWQRLALDVRARAFAAAGKPWQAAQARVKLEPLLSSDQRARNGNHIRQLLAGMDNNRLRQKARGLPSDDPMQSWLAQALRNKGVAMARNAPDLKRPVGTLLPGGTHAEGYQMPQQVALLLPLTGPTPLVAAAKAIRQGFFAAYFQDNRKGGQLPPVKVYDSAGTAAGALAAYHKAVDAGARLIVGPLSHAAVGAILDQDSLPTRVLTLNRPKDNTLPPPHVTEFALRPEAEGIQVARHMRERGLSRAFVLVSSDRFGQRAAKAFQAQFEGEDGKVLDTLTLDPAQVDYAEQIHSLHAHEDTDTGIFISMQPRQARLLLPQLRLARVTLPVFATSRVYGGSDHQVDDRDLDGVEFCDAPWLFNAQPGLPPRDSLASVLPTARGTSARFFAFGMDAWSLVPYLSWLRSQPGSYLPGATGRLSEDDFGHVHRSLTWARFHDGIARPLEGSLEMDEPVSRPLHTTGQDTPAAATSAPSNPFD